MMCTVLNDCSLSHVSETTVCAGHVVLTCANRIVLKTGIETENETKSAYSLVEDNHHIMHSYIIIYAFMHQARLQVEDFSARRLSIGDIKRLLLSEGLRTPQ